MYYVWDEMMRQKKFELEIYLVMEWLKVRMNIYIERGRGRGRGRFSSPPRLCVKWVVLNKILYAS